MRKIFFFGVMNIITSDRGTQFTSTLWSVLCAKLGIEHRLTTAYHPQSNPMIKRSYRQVKVALRVKIGWSALAGPFSKDLARSEEVCNQGGLGNILCRLQRYCTENWKKYSQKGNCTVSVPIPIFIYLWAIYIFPRSVCLYSCSKIGGMILEKYV